jgi:hypothetical protein
VRERRVKRASSSSDLVPSRSAGRIGLSAKGWHPPASSRRMGVTSGAPARDLLRLTRARKRAQTRCAVGLASRLGSLRSRDARLKDPLIGRLSEMPVPFFEGGSFVDGLREDERMSGLAPVTSRGDRELGAIAQCGLRFAFPLEGVPDLPEEEPALADVTQVVVLLSDTDAAARWFMTQTRRFEDLEGQEVGETLYRRVDVEITLTGLGEEATDVVAHTESADTPFCETYINFRTGRLFGSVGASTYKELEVRPQLRKLADRFLSRMESILTENDG